MVGGFGAELARCTRSARIKILHTYVSVGYRGG